MITVGELLYLSKNIIGNKKIVIDNKFNEQVPMQYKICKEGKLFEILKTIRFQGKPPKIKLLKNSMLPKKIEKIKIEESLFFKLKNLLKEVTNP